MERIIPAKTAVSAMAMAGNVPAYVMHRRGPLWLEWEGPVVGRWVREVRESPREVTETQEATIRTLALTEWHGKLFKGFEEW